MKEAKIENYDVTWAVRDWNGAAVQAGGIDRSPIEIINQGSNPLQPAMKSAVVKVVKANPMPTEKTVPLLMRSRNDRQAAAVLFAIFLKVDRYLPHLVIGSPLEGFSLHFLGFRIAMPPAE